MENLESHEIYVFQFSGLESHGISLLVRESHEKLECVLHFLQTQHNVFFTN